MMGPMNSSLDLPKSEHEVLTSLLPLYDIIVMKWCHLVMHIGMHEKNQYLNPSKPIRVKEINTRAF